VQALQDHRRAVQHQLDQPVVGDLVGDLRAGAAGAREPGRVDDLAVLRDPQERSAQPAPGQQLVDGGEVEQVVERRGQLGGRGQQRPPAPVRRGEVVRVRDTPAQRRAVGVPDLPAPTVDRGGQ
jgi:hypothetical protein